MSIDETKAYDHCVYDMIKNINITFDEFVIKRLEFTKQGLEGNNAAIKFYNLKKTPWHSEDEEIYDDTIKTLEYLVNNGYHLGVIGNQSKELDKRLEKFGILKYFEIIIAS